MHVWKIRKCGNELLIRFVCLYVLIQLGCLNCYELASDRGLLMIKEFLHTLGTEKLLKSSFRTNDPALARIHEDDENLLQMLYQIFGTYYEDNCADELRHGPVLSAVLGKKALASQPTLFRFFNRMDEDTLRQFDDIMRQLRKKYIPSKSWSSCFSISSLRCFRLMGNRKSKDLITIIRHMAIIPSCVSMP